MFTDAQVNNFRNDERVSVTEGIDMYTRGAAFATMQVSVSLSKIKILAHSHHVVCFYPLIYEVALQKNNSNNTTEFRPFYPLILHISREKKTNS